MTQSATANYSTAVNARKGGAVRVTMSSNVGQGNGGTSLPCRMCWVSVPSGNTVPTKINIDVAASATLGITIPEEATGANPFMVPIDDVSKIFVYSGGATDILDIMYVI